jgi:hypothetical protein
LFFGSQKLKDGDGIQILDGSSDGVLGSIGGGGDPYEKLDSGRGGNGEGSVDRKFLEEMRFTNGVLGGRNKKALQQILGGIKRDGVRGVTRKRDGEDYYKKICKGDHHN